MPRIDIQRHPFSVYIIEHQGNVCKFIFKYKAKPDPPAPCILKGKAKMIFPIIPLETSNAFEQTARTY